MLHLLVLVIAAGLALYYKFKPREGLPPLVGPGLFGTLAKLTTISDLSQLYFLHDLSLLLTRSGKGTSNGAVFRLSMPQMNPFIVSTDYKLARTVLEGNSKEHIPEAEKLAIFRSFDYASMASILTAPTGSSERYKHRKHLAVSFSIKNLEYTQQVMKECLQKFGDILEQQAAKKTPFMLDNAMIRLTLDIITESAFGVNFNTMVHSNDNLGEFYMEENELVLKEASSTSLNPFRKFMFWSESRNRALSAKTNVMNMAQNLIDTYRKNNATKGAADDRSIMGKLMSCDYPNDESRAQDILIMLLGGHETSSHTVAYLILALMRHPEIMARLRAELDACISADARHDITKLSCADITSLPYLSQCIKESMRMFSVVGGGFWRETIHDVHYEGYLIPAGSTFVSATYSMSRQPWIDRPDEFLPERWSETNPQYAQLKEVSIPFGAGKRQCIGQNLAKVEVAMIAAFTLRFFDFELVAEPVEQIFLTVKPVDMSVTVKVRE